MKCHEDKGLVISLGETDDIIKFRRCCFLEPFYICDRENFEKIKDPISFAENNNNIQKNFIKGIDDRCGTCILKEEIKSVSICLSRACNLACYNCFRNNHNEPNKNKKLYFSTLNKIKNHKLNSIILTDEGEPFFYFKETVKFLKKLSYEKDTKEVVITTNCSLLNDKRIEKLKAISTKTKIKYTFICSVDGCSQYTYERTRLKASFKETIYNVSKLLECFGPKNVKVAFTLKKRNCKDINNVIPFFKQLGVKILLFYYDIFDDAMKKLFYDSVGQFEFFL